MEWRDAYRLLIGAVQPRPIAWVSTLGADGSRNIAPFSFFMGVCARPFTLAFAPMWRLPEVARKDTLRNLEETGECVVNVVSEELAERMNLTSGEYRYDVDEFELAGLTALPSTTVAPPRIGESPVNFEARVSQIVTLAQEAGGGSIVILRVGAIHVDERVLEGTHVVTERLRPIGRLAGDEYARTTDRFALARPKVAR
ncbi:MAG: flavin reductase family protein [Candidatus Dormibacteria bacterium]